MDYWNSEFNVAKVTSKIEESFLTRMVEPFARYFRETRAELRKVSWPSRDEAWNLTLIVLAATTAERGEAGPPVSAFESDAEPVARGRIDELVFAKWKELGIEPANPCSDAVFVRRAYLDVIGTLPTAREARTFLQEQDKNKRAVLIDRLLGREEFADYWAMKWSDLLRVKSEFPINLWPNAVQAYHRWIRTAIRDNVPYDRFARELLTASGSNFRDAPVNFYRAVQSREPRAIASAVALTFMGERAEKWPKERLAGMAVPSPGWPDSRRPRRSRDFPSGRGPRPPAPPARSPAPAAGRGPGPAGPRSWRGRCR